MEKNGIKKLLLSDLLYNASKTQKIAYVGVLTALLVVCNMFFEIKFAEIQFSLTIFCSAFAGILIGPIFGFVASFMGDLVGFLYNSAGYLYVPWIGIAMGVVSLISGLVVNGINLKFKGEIYVKLLIVSLLTFLICTVGINTTVLWIIRTAKKVPYTTYAFTRLIIEGQIYNSLVNYGLLFIAVPIIGKIKYFKLNY